MRCLTQTPCIFHSANLSLMFSFIFDAILPSWRIQVWLAYFYFFCWLLFKSLLIFILHGPFLTYWTSVKITNCSAFPIMGETCFVWQAWLFFYCNRQWNQKLIAICLAVYLYWQKENCIKKYKLRFPQSKHFSLLFMIHHLQEFHSSGKFYSSEKDVRIKWEKSISHVSVVSQISHS